MLQHVSMQSTSSTNFSCVNALNKCESVVRMRERGRGPSRRAWGVENNEARELYLGTYMTVDRLNHYIKNCNLHYVSWKYWHSPRLHFLAMAIATAFDFYQECCEGKLDPEWKVEKPMTFKQFRMRLSTQMLKYDPRDKKYPGDRAFRVNTQRSSLSPQSGKKRPRQEQVTKKQYKDVKRGGKKSRLCGDLSHYLHHVHSYKSHDSRVCAYCGKGGATASCMICGEEGKGVPLHRKTGRSQDKDCDIKYHSDVCFGLSKSDRIPYLHLQKQDYTNPTKQQERENAALIKSYMNS